MELEDRREERRALRIDEHVRFPARETIRSGIGCFRVERRRERRARQGGQQNARDAGHEPILPECLTGGEHT
jgi:hypothetical protein